MLRLALTLLLVLHETECFAPSGLSFSQRRSTLLSVADVASSGSDENKKTLYEILGASPKESKDELKKKFVALARKSHPDARLDDKNTERLEFTEIAAAWRILSDPKQRQRYDRSLRAEQLSEDIASFVFKRAAPVTEMSVKALESIALPFLRRTTATTLATLQAAVNSKDFSKTLNNAMSAAARAGEAVDHLELQETSERLEKQAVQEYKTAIELQRALQEVATDRLELTLVTPNSGLTASEAELVLDNANRTILERAFSNLRTEIATLHSIEEGFVRQQKLDSEVQAKFQDAVRERLVAETAFIKAEREEAEARLIFEQAVTNLEHRRQTLANANDQVNQAELDAQRSSSELDRLTIRTAEQSEAVRQDLARKHHESIQTNETEEERRERLENLRQRERELSQKAKQLELQAAKKLSRSNKLKRRIQLLEQRRGQY